MGKCLFFLQKIHTFQTQVKKPNFKLVRCSIAGKKTTRMNTGGFFAAHLQRFAWISIMSRLQICNGCATVYFVSHSWISFSLPRSFAEKKRKNVGKLNLLNLNLMLGSVFQSNERGVVRKGVKGPWGRACYAVKYRSIYTAHFYFFLSFPISFQFLCSLPLSISEILCHS